jgi:hypothetical protein
VDVGCVYEGWGKVEGKRGEGSGLKCGNPDAADAQVQVESDQTDLLGSVFLTPVLILIWERVSSAPGLDHVGHLFSNAERRPTGNECDALFRRRADL